MNIIECTQGDSVWHSTRCGRITASRVKDALAFTAKGESKAERKRYMYELVCERLTGTSSRHYVTPEMERGVEMEPLARTAYELRSGNEVDTVSIAIHATLPFLAASPDGRIKPNGLVEFKCPTTAKHVEWLEAGKVPEEHALQMYTCLDVWEADFADFMSYDDRLPMGMQEFEARLWRDDTIITMIREGVTRFNDEVEDIVTRLRDRFPQPVVPEPPAPPRDPAMLYGDEIDEEFAELDALYRAQQ